MYPLRRNLAGEIGQEYQHRMVSRKLPGSCPVVAWSSDSSPPLTCVSTAGGRGAGGGPDGVGGPDCALSHPGEVAGGWTGGSLRAVPDCPLLPVAVMSSTTRSQRRWICSWRWGGGGRKGWGVQSEGLWFRVEGQVEGLEKLIDVVTAANYRRTCLYLSSCARSAL